MVASEIQSVEGRDRRTDMRFNDVTDSLLKRKVTEEIMERLGAHIAGN
jgi:hypothetical protein